LAADYAVHGYSTRGIQAQRSPDVGYRRRTTQAQPWRRGSGARQTLNAEQIGWFKAGSALNVIKSQGK
jgi:hypothetical protein